ncbi:two-component signal transduction [Rhodopirellula islandica]|uniref:histidine kinase n=1 Tax=Rhodopirellula islandica TaxID=595434 RepID=A0A0J1BLC2_RHOIS|nr:PAS domain S-box protein [Rhodopirellula islandica]KLU07341.1 two-component signal transduction [Rhodopirellula islandica]
MSELTTTEQQLRLALSMSSMGVIHMDYDTQLASADQQAARLFDLPPGVQVDRETVHLKFHPDDAVAINEHLAESMDPNGVGEFSMEHRIIHDNGDVRWLSIRKKVIFEERDGQRTPVSSLLAAVDITHKKQEEDFLKRSQETFENLVQNSPFGIYVVDTDLKMRYISKGAREHFTQFDPIEGHDLETIMFTIWRKEFATEIMRLFQHTLETGEPYQAPAFVENRHDTDQAESYEWQIERTTLPDGCFGVVCYFYDATEHEQVAESIRRREQYFREMTDAAPAMLWVTGADHSCTFLSRGWQDYTGQSQSDGLGIGWLDMVHPDDREDAHRIILSAFERRDPFEHDFRLRTVNGDYRWAIDAGRPKFNSQGQFEGYIGSVIDVHDRQVAETSLRQRAADIEASESRLRLAAETTGFGTYDITTTDSQNIWSDELFRILGLPADGAADENRYASLVHPDDRQRFRQTLRHSMLPDGPDQHSIEFRINRPDGETRWLIDTGCTFREGIQRSRRVVRRVGTVQDITDRKIFEQSLQRAKRSAEMANRSRGEFLANMSHEIRTPMSAILGHADILNDHLKDPDNLLVVETIRRNGNFLLAIINDILDLSKIDAGKMDLQKQPVRPDTIVGDIRSLMDVRAAEKDLPLKVEFAGPIPETIRTDAVRLRQILLNLVGNAIKFTNDGEVRLNIRYDQRSKLLNFDVIDTGVGIPSEKLDSLFEPFTQVDSTSTRSHGGTGLGLTICRRLSQALGGQIDVSSQPGKGSRFTLCLKVDASGKLIQPNLNSLPAQETPAPEVRLSANVLVVDDRRDIRYLAQHFIEKAGSTVYTATNGQEAIEFIESPDSPPVDLIVMDMQMPIMDGYEATTELRRRDCKLPIIALTANAMKSDREECLAAGCTDYTTKPLDQQKLIQMIARLTT